MRPRVLRLLGLVGGAVGVVLVLAVLGRPLPSPAQQPTPGAGASLPAGYAGTQSCKGCHEDQFVKFEKTKMGRLFLKHPRNMQERLACENCHGPGKAHADAGGGKGVGGLISFAKNDKTPVEARNATCLACHSKGPHLFWKGSAHEARDVGCTSCHTVMEDVSPKSQLTKTTEIETCGTCHVQRRAQMMRVSHMPLREGKMTCTSCHNPHGTVTPALLREIGLNETCYRCHAEKRGPFLWIHAPVPESCANCHDVHGSNHERMLKVAKPRLCQLCHMAGSHPTRPYGRGEPASIEFTEGRQCVNCHQNIHGSNHPSGTFFTR